MSKQEVGLRLGILDADHELSRLHRELVVGGVISEEEFWQTRKVRLCLCLYLDLPSVTTPTHTQLKSAHKLTPKAQQLLLSESLAASQKKGTTSEFLEDIQPERTDSEDVRITLTPEKIRAIFAQHPPGTINFF